MGRVVSYGSHTNERIIVIDTSVVVSKRERMNLIR